MKQVLERHNCSALIKYSIFILLLASLFSCATAHNIPEETFGDKTRGVSVETLQKINLLRSDLTGLSDKVDPAEAKELAETSICYSLYLA